ncbi:SiaB family protein kinase [Rhodoflexus sp.]
MNARDFCEQFQSQDIIMSYKGNANGDLLNNLIDVVQAKLAEIEPKSSVKKRVFNILVEVLQNIYHHCGHLPLEAFSDAEGVTFVLAKYQQDYYIIAGNYILNKEVPVLKARLDLINSLSAEKLKQVYMETLGNGVISDKGGAGLGLIEIARKSGRKLSYQFGKVSKDLSFFSLMVIIPTALSAVAQAN